MKFDKNHAMHKARMQCAEIARQRFFENSEADQPFGFSYLSFSFEVHVSVDLEGSEPVVILDVGKVTHTGQLADWVRVLI